MSMHKGMLGRIDETGPGSAPKSNTVVNPLGFVIQPSDQTLSDYIRRKQRQAALDSIAAEGKLTFEQWYSQHLIDFDGKHPSAAAVWKAAQENCW